MDDNTFALPAEVFQEAFLCRRILPSGVRYWRDAVTTRNFCLRYHKSMSDVKPTLDQLLAEIAEEVSSQDQKHPSGYGTSRDQVRLGLAALEDELKETHQAWNDEKRDPGWEHTREELLQVIGVATRLLRELPVSEAVVPSRSQDDTEIRLREALAPFAVFASHNVDPDPDWGWNESSCQRESIVTWFGPSEFRDAWAAFTDNRMQVLDYEADGVIERSDMDQ